MDNNTVMIQRLGRKSKKWQSYYGVNFERKKGEIVQVLRNSKREEQGYRVRFSSVEIRVDGKGQKKTIPNFEFSLYKAEVKRIEGDPQLPRLRKEKARRMLKSNKTAVRRLRVREGLKIEDLAERFDVNERTIYHWLSEKT